MAQQELHAPHSAFQYRRCELIRKSAYDGVNPEFVRRLVTAGLIVLERQGPHCLYSDTSVRQLQACLGLRGFGLEIPEMRRVLKAVTLDDLEKRIQEDTPTVFHGFLKSNGILDAARPTLVSVRAPAGG